MANLPSKTDLTSPSTTEAAFQSGIGSLYDYLAQLVSGSTPASITINADTVTPTGTFLILDTEGSASTDLLKNILPTNVGNKVIFLRTNSSSRVITLKHLATGTGQLRLNTGADTVLDNNNKFIAFVYDPSSSRWTELWRNWGVYLPGSMDITDAFSALGLGDAALVDIGSGSGEVPTNSLLGALAYLSTISSASVFADGVITGAKLAAATIPLSKLANDTAGNIPVFNASGVISKIAPSASGKYLRDNGPGNVPSFETLSVPSQDVALIGNYDLTGQNSIFPTWTSGAYKRIGVDFVNVRLAGAGVSNGFCFRLFNSGTEYNGNTYRIILNGTYPINFNPVSATSQWLIGTMAPTGNSLSGSLLVTPGDDSLESFPMLTGKLLDTPVSGAAAKTHAFEGMLAIKNIHPTGFRIFRDTGGSFTAGTVRIWGYK